MQSLRIKSQRRRVLGNDEYTEGEGERKHTSSLRLGLTRSRIFLGSRRKVARGARRSRLGPNASYPEGIFEDGLGAGVGKRPGQHTAHDVWSSSAVRLAVVPSSTMVDDRPSRR